MLGEIVAVVRSTASRWLGGIGRLIKRFLVPGSEMVVGVAQDAVRSMPELVAENAMMRQQLIVARRSAKRPAFRDGDGLVMVLLARLNRAWRGSLQLIRPATLLRWHRDLFKMVWRQKSRTARREPRIPQATIDLIKTMAAENPWGAERIRGAAVGPGRLW